MSEGFLKEDARLTSNTDSNQTTVDALASAGQMLKQARVNAGLHIAALAVTLKVPVKRLEALEEGNMDLLPDIVFVRALASSVCRTLKIDPAPILDKLPKATSPRLNNTDGSLNMPIRIANSNAQSQWSDVIKAPWLIGVALLVCGAALIYFWPKSAATTLFDMSAVTKAMPSLGATPNTVVAVQTEGVLPSSKLLPATIKSSTELSSDLVQMLPKEAASAVDVSTTVSADSGVPANSFALITTNATVPPNSIVVFKATGQTWVEVKSVNGITIFKKLLNSGEAAGASGTLPLTVIVGRADVTQVEVRGKPIDLTAIAKSNVARFEVN